MPEALLLDAGQTILFVDHEVIRAVLSSAGHDIGVAALRDTQHRAVRAYVAELQDGRRHEDGWRRFMESWMELAGVPRLAAPEAVTLLRSEHDRFNLWRSLPDDVPPALARARAAGMKVAVVSNSEGKLVELLERVGLGDSFDAIVDSGVEGCHKPDPEIFWLVCRRIGVAPERCVYAGDIPEVDVVGARRAGIPAVLIDAQGMYGDDCDAPRYASVAAFIGELIHSASAP